MACVPYASASGTLVYAMMCTCPNICFVVGLLSHFQSNRRHAHQQAIKRILRYLYGMTNCMLSY